MTSMRILKVFIAVALWIGISDPTHAFLLKDDEKVLDGYFRQGKHERITAFFRERLAQERKAGESAGLYYRYSSVGRWRNVKRLKKWCQESVDSYLPWTFLAVAYLDKALEYRGTDYSYKVLEEYLVRFRKHLSEAKVYLDKVVEMEPEDPYPYVFQMVIAKYQGRAKYIIKGHFQKAVSILPNCEQAMWQMAFYYSPLWNGSELEMKEFIDRYARKAPKGSPIRLLIVDYHEEVSKNRRMIFKYFGKIKVWNDIRKELEGYLSVHPDHLGVRSRYARMAYYAGKYCVARKQFGLSEDHWEGGGWFSKEWFDKMKAKAHEKCEKKK